MLDGGENSTMHSTVRLLHGHRMKIFRLFLRLFGVSDVRKARYAYTPSPAMRPVEHVRLATVQVSRETMCLVTSDAGATLTGRCWVIDGDTIDIGGKRIRLAGIDAPELDHPFGKNAKRELIKLCQGQQVRAEFDGTLSHDRSMATCYLPDGRDLSAEMVKAGLAIDWPKYSAGKYRRFETDGLRRKLWRCDARQKGRMPPASPRYD